MSEYVFAYRCNIHTITTIYADVISTNWIRWSQYNSLGISCSNCQSSRFTWHARYQTGSNTVSPVWCLDNCRQIAYKFTGFDFWDPSLPPQNTSLDNTDCIASKKQRLLCMSLAAAVYLFGEGDIHQRKSTWSPRGFHAGKIRSGAASFSLLVGWIDG